jgi:hypothetical protein
MRLQAARLAAVSFRHVEDHRMGVELGCGIAIDWPGGIVLEGGSDELSRGLRFPYIADACLCVLFQFPECLANTLAVRNSHPLVAADQCSERYRLGSGECGVPSGTVFGADDFFSELSLVGPRDLVPYQLLFRVRVLSFAQPREVLCFDRACELPLLGEPSLPLAVGLLLAAPIVLFLRSELTFVIGSCLTGGQRFRDGEHNECFFMDASTKDHGTT